MGWLSWLGALRGSTLNPSKAANCRKQDLASLCQIGVATIIMSIDGPEMKEVYSIGGIISGNTDGDMKHGNERITFFFCVMLRPRCKIRMLIQRRSVVPRGASMEKNLSSRNLPTVSKWKG